MRLVFMGTPAFAVPTLEALLSSSHQVVAVFSQPDKPAGRGGKLSLPPTKQLAQRHQLPVYQPLKLHKEEWEPIFRALLPDALVVVAYGKILPVWLIDLAPLGAFNLHSSLLPKYRGAAPINWAIANGETMTGVSTMQIDAGMDTGDILLQHAVEIASTTTAGELHDQLAACGANLMLETLALAERQELRPSPQDNAHASYAPRMKKEDGQLNWFEPAATLYNRVRGLNPWPGTYTWWRQQLLRIWKAAPFAEFNSPHPAATLQYHAGLGAVVQCGQGGLQLLEVQLENHKRVSAPDFLNGLRLREGETIALGR